MLTEKIIRDLKAENKTRILRDHQQRGLGVRVTAAGVKSYVLEYYIGKRRRLATLGRCNEMSLREARTSAGAWQVRIHAGEGDPLKARHERPAGTVNDAIDRFFREYVPQRQRAGRMSESTAATYRAQAERVIRPAIGDMAPADVRRSHIESAVAPLPPISRNRVLALTSRLFNLFEYWEIRAQNSNPTKGIDRARETPRDRVLSDAEFAALEAVLAKRREQNPWSVNAILFAAVTGLRIGEVLAIRWEDVSVSHRMLHLPRSKTGARDQALSATAFAVLESVPRVNASPYVFSNVGTKPLAYETVRLYFNDCLEEAGLSGIHLHDLRRTVMTNAAIEGVGAHVLRDMLGHKSSRQADRYIRRTGAALRAAVEKSGAAMGAKMPTLLSNESDDAAP